MMINQSPNLYLDSYHKNQGDIVRRSLAGENAIVVSGRGWGKSIAGRGVIYLNSINYKGYTPPLAKTKLFNVIAAPRLNHLKKIHWEPLEYIFTETPLKALVKNINRGEGYITFKGSQPGIMLAGLNDDNGAKIRGFSIPRLFIDEFQDVKPNIWAAIKPAVDRVSGNVLVCGTPKGKGTNFHKFSQEMPANFGWKYYHFFTKDNPKIPNIDRVLLEARSGLTEREFKAEYEASWEDFPGQIFDHLEARHFIDLELSPNNYEFCCLGIDWGDVHPAIVVIGIKDYPYKYYLIEAWQGISGLSIPFDVVKQKALELAQRYKIHSTYPDVFQPGNMNYIYELMQMPHTGLKNIVDPQSADYTRMRSLRVMPSCAQLNRLFMSDRFFINNNCMVGDHFHKEHLENQLRGYRRKQDREGHFLDEPHPGIEIHLGDCARYVISNIENTLTIAYGCAESIYSPFGY